jgi:hypothetical protein
MLQAFARLVADLFPSVDPKNVKDFLRKHWKHFPLPVDLFATQIPPAICQGDILTPITFVIQDQSGEFGEIEAPGMLLSHSCDFDTDDHIIFAVCRPMSDYVTHSAISNIRSNLYFNTFSLEGTPEVGDIVVDFGIVQSVRRTVLSESISDGRIRRVASLTTLGYYFFLAKFTVRFLRPQSMEEVRNHSAPPFLSRSIHAAQAVVSLCSYVLRGRP